MNSIGYFMHLISIIIVSFGNQAVHVSEPTFCALVSLKTVTLNLLPLYI